MDYFSVAEGAIPKIFEKGIFSYNENVLLKRLKISDGAKISV